MSSGEPAVCATIKRNIRRDSREKRDALRAKDRAEREIDRLRTEERRIRRLVDAAAAEDGVGTGLSADPDGRQRRRSRSDRLRNTADAALQAYGAITAAVAPELNRRLQRILREIADQERIIDEATRNQEAYDRFLNGDFDAFREHECTGNMMNYMTF